MAATVPNLLLVLTDMQRADTLHALGNPVIRTPHWDALIREGTAFTSCYTPSPVCVSARYALHYGLWPSATGVTENQPMPPDTGRSLASQLVARGYRTHAVGKLHFSGDRDRGFQSRDSQEEIVGHPDQDDYLRYLREHGYGWIRDPHGVRGEMYYIPQVAQMPEEHHPSRWVADRAIGFIERQDPRQPWMLLASFIHPHPPFAPPNPWHKLYRGFDMPLPVVPPQHEHLLTWINRVQNRGKYRDQGDSLHLLRLMKAYYYACISFVDCQIGRIRAALQARGLDERTLIVTTSDHGEFLGDLGCFGKRSMHDASARVPLVARLPGALPAGARVDQPVSLVDIPQTLLALAGAPPAETGMSGVDLREVAAGTCRRQAVFAQCGSGNAAQYLIATPQWKYIWSAPDQAAWLFDRVRDPGETRNRIGLPTCHSAVRSLSRQLQAFLRACGTTDALTGSIGQEQWQPFPTLVVPSDPDTGLMVQDHPWADQRIDGYTDTLPPAIARWRVLGPFAASAVGRVIDQVPACEAALLQEERASAPAAAAAAAGAGASAAHAPALPWQEAVADRRGCVDLGRCFGELERVNAYARCEITSAEACPAVLVCGSDDGLALWLNGVEVHRDEQARPFRPEDDEVPVRLRPGVNRLLVKCSNLSGGWGFGIRLRLLEAKA